MVEAFVGSAGCRLGNRAGRVKLSMYIRRVSADLYTTANCT